MDETPISNPFDEDEAKGRQPVVWALLGIIVVGCILFSALLFLYFRPDAKSLIDRYFPSPTATTTHTPTSTPTVTPTSTSTATPTPNMTATQRLLGFTATAQSYLATASSAAEQWKVSLSETFDDNRHDWLLDSADNGEYRSISYKISDGKYRWDVTAHQSVITWIKTNNKEYKDFYLSVDIQQVEGPDDADYGIVFREDADGNFYYFGINNHAKYFLYLYNNDSWKTLILPWTSPAIHKGEVNNIKILAEEGHFVFFINDQFVAETTNDTLSSGEISLAIELPKKDDHAVFEFDNLEIRSP